MYPSVSGDGERTAVEVFSGMGAGGSKEDPAVDQMGWRIAAASSSGRGKMSVWIYCYLSGYQNQ